MKRSASLALVIHSLRPVITQAVAALRGARRQRERVAAGAGFRERVRADRAPIGEARQVALLCRSSCPQRRSALMTSVFCTSTSTPIDGSTRDSASTARTEWKNVAPAPPCDSGISMPMTPSSKSWSMSARGIFACSSISRTSGRISRSRELVHAVAEEAFIFGEQCRAGGVVSSPG